MFLINVLKSYINSERLVDVINSSQELLRHRFLLSLSVDGSASMLGPLLFHGLSMKGHLLLNYRASLSLETSTQLQELIISNLKTVFDDPSKSEAFCHSLKQALESCGPLQGLDAEHAIFESLVRMFQKALLQSNMQHIKYSKSSSDDCICNKIVRLLLEADLFRDSKLPARYWSFHLSLNNGHQSEESPLTLAIRVGNIYTMRLLIENSYDVDDVHQSPGCMENKGTPLTYAVWLGYTEAVTILLEAGAHITKMGIAPEMAENCLSFPTAKNPLGRAKHTGLEDCKDDTGARHQIFGMVCRFEDNSRNGVRGLRRCSTTLYPRIVLGICRYTECLF